MIDALNKVDIKIITGEEQGGGIQSGCSALVASLFDDEFYIDRYNTFKSATAGFLLLTLFTQNCTQLRLLFLAKNHPDYTGKPKFFFGADNCHLLADLRQL